MKHKYKLGDYVEYYKSYCKNEYEYEYMNKKQGFINAIEERMQEDGNVVLNYLIGDYIGSCGRYIVREEMIVGKLKAPKNQGKLEYLKAKVRENEAQIESLNDENEELRTEIEILEKEKKK